MIATFIIGLVINSVTTVAQPIIHKASPLAPVPGHSVWTEKFLNVDSSLAGQCYNSFENKSHPYKTPKVNDCTAARAALPASISNSGCACPTGKKPIDFSCQNDCDVQDLSQFNGKGALGYVTTCYYTCPEPAKVTTTKGLKVAVKNFSLNGQIDSLGSSSQGSVIFLYGKNTNYGLSTSEISVNSKGPISTNIKTECGTTYHFQAVLKTNDGVIKGADSTFTSDPCPKPVTSCTTSCPAGFTLVADSCK